MKSKLFGFWNFKIMGFLGACYLIFNRMMELVLQKTTSFFIKKNLGACGSNVSIERGFNYRNPSRIKLGSNVQIGKNVVFTSELKDGYLVIQDNVVIGRHSKIDFSGGLTIKKGVLLSENVMIQTHDHGLDPRSKPIGKELEIKENVWLGLNTLVLSNTRLIGENSVIASGSIVTKAVAPNSVYAGIPAVLKKVYRK